MIQHHILVSRPYPACLLAVTHPLRPASKTDLAQLFRAQRTTGPVRRISLKDKTGEMK